MLSVLFYVVCSAMMHVALGVISELEEGRGGSHLVCPLRHCHRQTDRQNNKVFASGANVRQGAWLPAYRMRTKAVFGELTYG
jgi:hypothetical protein